MPILKKLGHIYIKGQKYTWEVSKELLENGRDDDLTKTYRTDKWSADYPPGRNDLIDLISDVIKRSTIQEVLFKLVNYLFSDYGLDNIDS